jgi:hypothetical protein
VGLSLICGKRGNPRPPFLTRKHGFAGLAETRSDSYESRQPGSQPITPADCRTLSRLARKRRPHI